MYIASSILKRKKKKNVYFLQKYDKLSYNELIVFLKSAIADSSAKSSNRILSAKMPPGIITFSISTPICLDNLMLSSPKRAKLGFSSSYGDATIRQILTMNDHLLAV
jgi:hypothetical protein